jgi:transcriptional regulator with XRE-family HTH domain
MSDRKMPTFSHELLANLKRRRHSIEPESLVIGEYRREPWRVGRPVTQEEIADVLKISREWYCALENGRCTEVSPDLITRVLLALYDKRTARRVRWQREAASVVDHSELRRYIKRVSSVSSYLEAALQAIETGSKLLAVTCVSIVSFETGGGEISGHAHGPQARFWKPLCDRIVQDAHRPLRTGGLGVSECVPTVDEVATDPSVLLTFESPGSQHDYEYACSPELWRDFNGDLGIRSAIVLPLRDRLGYRGTAAFSWSEPRNIELREIELARSLVGVLELIS